MTEIKHPNWRFQYGPWDLRINCPKCGKFEAWFVNGQRDCDQDGHVHGCECRQCGFKDDLLLVGCTPEVVKSVVEHLEAIKRVQ